MSKVIAFAMAAGLMLPITGLSAANAADVKVTWEEPSKYVDVQAADGSQKRFQENVFARFEEIFAELASELPSDQTLHITVTNVDLAGAIEYHDINGVPRELRIVRGHDFPMMQLSYKLVDSDGEVIQEGESRMRGRELPGQSRLSTPSSSRGGNLLEYEKPMVTEWFKNEFKQD
ncbi:DUF3016 domain-containing protein [Aliidiomarina haloalkalitolerans]|uniref:DUF3016 domain-containing protein n=1 Tax=Aliidiomarina haloalkalitolerans TaxID=859059 RepID=A0A432VUW3_9GAMM|nr:DUF3016 domain-containing protein [Aliidiomarina haloalkalitolerans]MCL4409788.1 DUF3016 domain-containing protein [Gammaproteobacteria bacterium]RUO20327.1 hypothetical protein CWE06_06820 [Aliidiomarina haloalkalitolerans]